MITSKESESQDQILKKIQSIKWNSLIDPDDQKHGFFYQYVNEFRDLLPRFKHASDDQIEDFD